MRKLAAGIIAAICLAGVSAADERRSALYGSWGDARQCARDLIIPGGTVRAEPFEIAEGWLRHRQIWCQLSWFDVTFRPGGLFTTAVALCGDDSTRSYRLDFALSHGFLTLIWDETLVNGPLGRCVEG